MNGLHELNNTRGHAAGDEMLKTVAAKVRDIFGEKYSYRVGGDEFVAFAMDKSAEEMRALIHKLVQEVDEAGYSVAVGTATHSAGGIDMEVLVKSAETRMYLAKEEHYRLAGRPRDKMQKAVHCRTLRRCAAFLRSIFLFLAVRGRIYCIHLRIRRGEDAAFDHCGHCYRSGCGRHRHRAAVRPGKL